MIDQEYYRRLSKTETTLITEMEKMHIIDSHEHLPSEEMRVDTNIDALTLFSNYCIYDFNIAGRKPGAQHALSGSDASEDIFTQFGCDWKPSKCIEERWQSIKPYYEQMKNTNYSRAAHIAMKRFYGVDTLSDKTIEVLTQRVQAQNKPGLYKKVISEACNIDCCLNQGLFRYRSRGSEPLLKDVAGVPIPQSNEELSEITGGQTIDLDTYLNRIERYIAEEKALGSLGLKIKALPLGVDQPRFDEAQSAFTQMQRGQPIALDASNAYRDYAYDFVARKAAENELVLCVHTGYWNDYRQLSPAHLLPLIFRNPETKFDVYHLGYPYVREAIMLAKACGNVWLNLCWTYIISQKFAQDGLSELLEMIPANKVIGFGGDYRIVEKIFGHLILARESIARAVGARIDEGTMRVGDGVAICRKLLVENPCNLYGIKQN